MKKHFLLLTVLIILLTILCSCESDSKTTNKCIDCGKKATHYMGVELRDYSTVDLYYCDDCYDKAFEEKYKDYPVAPTIPR